jgi:hypothetical protein
MAMRQCEPPRVSSVVRPSDDGAAQFDGQGFDGQVITRLVDGMVESPSQGQLPFPRHAWPLLVDERDPAQQPVFSGVSRVL